MNWLTGYDGWSFYVPVRAARARGRAAVVRPRPGYQRRQVTTWLARENMIGYPDHYVQSTERHPMDYLSSEVIAARGWQDKRIGVEMDNYYFSAAAFASLQKHPPQASFVDTNGLVNWQRAVKSEQEIAYMRIAARIVEKMHDKILEVIEPGMRRTSWWRRSTRPRSSVPRATAATIRRSCRCCPPAPTPRRRT